MLHPIRIAFATLLFVLAIMGGGELVFAIANPSAILWDSPDPAAFVTSLYKGVLGREPESTAVVAAWASQVTGDMRSRLRVFQGFVDSAEYRTKYPGGIKGRYTVWANTCPHDANEVLYRVSVGMPQQGSWRAQKRFVTPDYGRVLVGYYSAAFPFRSPCVLERPPGP